MEFGLLLGVCLPQKLCLLGGSVPLLLQLTLLPLQSLPLLLPSPLPTYPLLPPPAAPSSTTAAITLPLATWVGLLFLSYLF